MRGEDPAHDERAILAAARELALRSGVRTVSLCAVAAAVGLAKSNVVRYFGTREEIYLELAGAQKSLGASGRPGVTRRPEVIKRSDLFDAARLTPGQIDAELFRGAEDVLVGVTHLDGHA
ncbi:helix-turn-helix domain-containing protein, partial [Nonomuraea sp. NPDC049750]|uniref:TetR/AcrR family transcriptional regulator n=1 Tax=Nonomuraea sp. NPDC049750 TaxID=3154738 RepID=UPI0033DE69E7